jgi:DNA-binding GntR family transcriptional regulator
MGRAPHRHREITGALRGGRTEAARDYLEEEIRMAGDFLLEVMTFREE